jgi:hypothetical protein
MGAASSLNNPLSTASVQCSPVTEIYNGTTDLAFSSVPNDADGTQCSDGSGAGCIMSFQLPSSGSLSSTNATSSANAVESGGTSGIIIDNVSAQTGSSNVYFSTLSNGPCGTSGTGGCAVQAGQNGL